MSCRQSKKVTKSRSFSGIIFGRADGEMCIADVVFASMRFGLFDRAWMEIVSEELRAWKRLRHQDSGPAVTAAEIGHPCAAGPVCPPRRQVLATSWQPDYSDSQGGRIAPRNKTSRDRNRPRRHHRHCLKATCTLRLAVGPRCDTIEGAKHRHRAILDRKYHRLLRRQGIGLMGRVIGHVV